MDTSHLLSASVTPVVLISACGLVTLALYNRLGTILARIRVFHQRKLELLDHLHKREVDEQEVLLNMLDSQIMQVTDKARMIQKGLFCLLGSIASLLICSFCAGAMSIHSVFGIIAVTAGVIGLFSFLTGIGWALRELSLSISPLEEESNYLEALTEQQLAKIKNNAKLKIAESA